MITSSRFRDISPDRSDEFLDKGVPKRCFFPHRSYYLPKAGPDALKLASWTCGVLYPRKPVEIVLYASPSTIEDFPKDLFFDKDIIWHQQHFGICGHVAYACLAVGRNKLYGLNYVSDLVQRISRKRMSKTQIENKFKGWELMILNSIMVFALENNIKTLYSPTADLVLNNTDRSRRATIKRELFDRIYDRSIRKLFDARRTTKWWIIDTGKNRNRVVLPETRQEYLPSEKTICLFHDIEKGLGHTGTDQELANAASSSSDYALKEMLRIEKELGIKATYNVVGTILNDVRSLIEQNGQCLAFHSYDHGHYDQLANCRQVDYRIMGYRPPQSRITSELSDPRLRYHNFEWIASSARSLGTNRPMIKNGIVKIPILFDDFDMYKRKMAYAKWEEKAIGLINRNDFVAFGLHDCYSGYWLPHYKRFLEKVRNTGKFKTFDEVANETILSSAL